MTVREACSIFLEQESRIRNLRRGTIQGYETVFRSLLRWAEEKGLSVLEDLDESAIRAWVGSWTCRPSTTRQRLCQLKAFFRFTVERGWDTRVLLATLRPPRSDSPGTMPLEVSEVRALLTASKDQPKEQALILLMRFSGLAIGDAVAMKREAVNGPELTLRRAKSGELVTVNLPDPVVRAMASIRGANPEYFWWSGRGEPVTCAKYWRARLGIIADRAGVAGFRPHRLRDTFAVSLLGQGVAIEDVSALLGHRSILTTERYYAPWNRSRRERLRRIVQEANRSDPVLADIDRRTSGVVPREAESRQSSAWRPPPELQVASQADEGEAGATDFDVGRPLTLPFSEQSGTCGRR
ncbi:MAG: tyrosine-type recombinase/integrase [Chloroflexi bacterium]|nr:tyrosine-type recombinase/integrase [Chloroflexota bacterium]